MTSEAEAHNSHDHDAQATEAPNDEELASLVNDLAALGFFSVKDTGSAAGEGCKAEQEPEAKAEEVYVYKHFIVTPLSHLLHYRYNRSIG